MQDLLNYQRDGFLIFDPGFPDDLLDTAAEFTYDAVKRPGRLQDAWLKEESVKQIALFPTVLHALQSLHGGKRPMPFQTLNFAVGTQQATHSDTIHFNSSPPGLMCGVWTALEDIDESNGPLVYYPGSHRLPEETMQSFGLHPNWDDYPEYEAAIRRLIEEHGLEPQLGTIKRGEAIIWAANLLHGGSPIKDPDRTRLSQVTHYFFEGADHYYTPLHSQPGKIAQRHIREIS